MISFEVGSVLLETIPSLFMLLSLYLHQAKVFKLTFRVSAKASHLMCQKDLFEYGTAQLAVGAVASYLEGFTIAVAALLLLALVWIVVPYFTITLLQGNRLGWVKQDKLSIIYITMMLAISIGARYLEVVWTIAPLLAFGVVISTAIFIGEFLRS